MTVRVIECTNSLQRGLGIAAEDCGRSSRPRAPMPCFNGASASLPRIVRTHPRVFAVPERFNGASASLPRIVGVQEVCLVMNELLQRGLGIAAEDCASTAITSSGSPPRFNGASASLPRIAACITTICGWATCFNGASASLPRIGVAVATAATHWLMLQRGLGIAAGAPPLPLTLVRPRRGIAARQRRGSCSSRTSEGGDDCRIPRCTGTGRRGVQERSSNGVGPQALF